MNNLQPAPALNSVTEKFTEQQRRNLARCAAVLSNRAEMLRRANAAKALADFMAERGLK